MSLLPQSSFPQNQVAATQSLRRDPAQVLPLELLSIIFQICIDDYGMTPLRLTHVSHWWRDLATGLPQLWTHLRIPCPHVGQGPHGHCAQICSDWITRSGPHLVSIQLPPHEQDSCMAELLAKDVLAANGEKIAALELRLPGEITESPSPTALSFLNLPHSSFPALEELTLYINFDTYTFTDPANIATSFNGSPLRHLDLNYSSFYGEPTPDQVLDLDWGRLDSFAVYNSTSLWWDVEGMTCFVLTQLRNITSLTFTVLADVGAYASDVLERATFPNLRILRLTTEIDCEDLECNDKVFYQALECPKLETVELTLSSVDMDEVEVKCFNSGFFSDVGFRRTSLAHLRSLYLRNYAGISTQQLLDVLEETPMLEQLELIDSIRIQPTFYERLAVPATLVPRLRLLKIKYPIESVADMLSMAPAIEAMLRGRWDAQNLAKPGVSLLQAVSITSLKFSYDAAWVTLECPARLSTFRPVSQCRHLLSLEVLSEVFRYAVDGYRSAVDGGTSPLRLTHVCVLWRDIVLASPRLWTHLRIPCPHRGQGPHENCVRMCNTWIKLSGEHDVSIELPRYEEDSCMTGLLAERLLALKSNAKRITKLDLHLPGEEGKPGRESLLSFLTLPYDSLPALKDLRLIIEFTLSCTDTIVTSFDGCVEHLSIDYFCDEQGDKGPSDLFELQWDCIESLDLRFNFYTSPDLVVELVSALVDNRRLTITIDTFDDIAARESSTSFNRSRCLRDLRYLEVKSRCLNDTDSEKPFWEAFSCPGLETLVVRASAPSMVHCGIFDSEHFRTTSLTKLRVLRIQEYEVVPCEGMIEVLKSTPMLEELACSLLVGDHLAFLHQLAHPTTLVPRLRKVVFNHDCHEEQDFNAVVRGIEVLLRGRWGDTSSPLKDVIIYASSDNYEFEPAWVDSLRELPSLDDANWSVGPVSQIMDCDTLCEDLASVSLSTSMEL
ncbi:hypothetical protein EV121DRAFT_210180 [Schizophyllum commune]